MCRVDDETAVNNYYSIDATSSDYTITRNNVLLSTKFSFSTITPFAPTILGNQKFS